VRTLDALRRSRLAEPPPPAALAELTASLAAEAARARPPAAGDRGLAWRVPLLATPAVEAWLLGWPAGQVTPAHGHGRSVVALTVVEGTLSEECLDPTIWTTCRRTTWRAGSTTVFPPGHVHVLGAAGRGPAAAVHAWSPLGAGPADRGATASACPTGGDTASAGPLRPFPLPGRGAGLRSLGGGLAGSGGGRGGRAVPAARLARGRAGQAKHPADGPLDERHVGDGVSG
jgi:quercetin dioxygenase-like cupin family protein